jgi:hypothetical protein
VLEAAHLLPAEALDAAVALPLGAALGAAAAAHGECN